MHRQSLSLVPTKGSSCGRVYATFAGRWSCPRHSVCLRLPKIEAGDPVVLLPADWPYLSSVYKFQTCSSSISNSQRVFSITLIFTWLDPTRWPTTPPTDFSHFDTEAAYS